MLLSFNDLNSKTLSFSDNPFRLRPMFIGKVTEQSSASSPTDQQEVDEEEEEEEDITVSQIKEELHEALKGEFRFNHFKQKKNLYFLRFESLCGAKG